MLFKKIAVVGASIMSLLMGTAALGHAAPLSKTTLADNTGPFHVAQYINWDGSCLDIHTATLGERLGSVACGSPGDLWWIYTSGQLSPQGHPGYSVGDSGGLLELRTAPSTAVTYDAAMSGYLRICFAASGGGCVPATRWLSNGVGNNVTITSAGVNDTYWDPNPQPGS